MRYATSKLALPIDIQIGGRPYEESLLVDDIRRRMGMHANEGVLGKVFRFFRRSAAPAEQTPQTVRQPREPTRLGVQI